MPNDGTGFKKVYLEIRFTNLCRGIGGLARIICFQFQFDSYDKNTLFLFCGKRMDRINPFIPYVLLRRNTYPRRYTI